MAAFNSRAVCLQLEEKDDMTTPQSLRALEETGLWLDLGHCIIARHGSQTCLCALL